MNKYETFFIDLKKYLIENDFQIEDDFKNINVDQIENLNLKVPLAYKEWLKVFGNTSCLLNYPIEDYTLEELEFAQEDDAKDKIFEEETRKLLLISIFQDLNTYIVQEEENPTTYQINIGNPILEEKLRNQGKFTTHIKSIIIHLINNERAKLNNWFNEDIIDYSKAPFEKKQKYLQLLETVENLEEKENRLYSINEIVKIWNDENKKNSP